jgi:hypothetical protein
MTISISRRKLTLVALLIAGMLVLALPSVVTAKEPPIKEILTSRIGWEVDTITKGPVCTVASGHECQQPATSSSEPGGFEGVEGVAGGGAPAGHVYVTDGDNHRVQELAANGEFIAMFGREVNANKTNVCLAGETCKAGVEGTLPGQFSLPQSIAVDPTNDDFYVAERHSGAERVQKFTANGQFILEIGKEVNVTTKGNLCTQTEIAKCKEPAQVTTPEPGAFAFTPNQGNILAVGGPEDHLYVGDEHTVQEFRPDGTWAGEPLAKTEATATRLTEISSAPQSAVTRIAVDHTGIVYLGYSVTCGCLPPRAVREFDKTGKEIKEFATVDNAVLLGLATDSVGRLAAVENKDGVPHHYLYEVTATKLHLLTEFSTVVKIDDISFNGNDELYGVGDNIREITAYHPVTVGELLTAPVTCAEGDVNETSVTLDCTLNGEADPWGVKETEVWFEWGRTVSLGEKTTPQPIPNEQPVEGLEEMPLPPCSEHKGEHSARHEAKCPEAKIKGVRPHDPLYYQLAGHDLKVIAPELLTSELELAQAPAVAPRIVGEPKVSFVKSAVAVMSGKLNPENIGTHYAFQYGPCEGGLQEKCTGSPYTAETPSSQSAAYSAINTTLEASGLQPDTLYHYRLMATNEENQGAVNQTGGPELPEGTFTTARAPVPEAETGQPSAIGTTTATIAGAVNPDGQPSTYSFEVQTGNDTRKILTSVHSQRRRRHHTRARDVYSHRAATRRSVRVQNHRQKRFRHSDRHTRDIYYRRLVVCSDAAGSASSTTRPEYRIPETGGNHPEETHPSTGIRKCLEGVQEEVKEATHKLQTQGTQEVRSEQAEGQEEIANLSHGCE